MALLHVNFFSETLGMCTAMDVIWPQRKNGRGVDTVGEDRPVDVPVLYLLHGASGNHTDWQRKTAIERYVEGRRLAVVMPSTDLGFYTDMVHGFPYFTFFRDELPGIVREFFPRVTRTREKTFVAGLSMGGFGAFKLALNCPEMFGAAASLSGALDMAGHLAENEPSAIWEQFRLVFGSAEDVKDSENDLLYQGEKLLESDRPQPLLYQCCGTEDFLYEDNRRFRSRFLDRLPLTYHEESGTHEWGYWDRNIQRVLDWLPIEAETAHDEAEGE